MGALLREVSTITAKGQTTVPKSVRQALGVGSGERITFVVDDMRRVSIERTVEETRDPVVESFLNFLANDMAANARTSILPLPAALYDRVAALVGDMAVDLDDDIDGDIVI